MDSTSWRVASHAFTAHQVFHRFDMTITDNFHLLPESGIAFTGHGGDADDLVGNTSKCADHHCAGPGLLLKDLFLRS